MSQLELRLFQVVRNEKLYLHHVRLFSFLFNLVVKKKNSSIRLPEDSGSWGGVEMHPPACVVFGRAWWTRPCFQPSVEFTPVSYAVIPFIYVPTLHEAVAQLFPTFTDLIPNFLLKMTPSLFPFVLPSEVFWGWIPGTSRDPTCKRLSVTIFCTRCRGFLAIKAVDYTTCDSAHSYDKALFLEVVCMFDTRLCVCLMAGVCCAAVWHQNVEVSHCSTASLT